MDGVSDSLVVQFWCKAPPGPWGDPRFLPVNQRVQEPLKLNTFRSVCTIVVVRTVLLKLVHPGSAAQTSTKA